MKYVKEDWIRRSSIVLVVSLIVSVLLWTLSLTDWAATMNTAQHLGNHPEREAPPAILMFIMPFIKVTLLTVIPAAICLFVVRAARWVKSIVKTGLHMQQ
jgi:hypothetical protein